MRPNPRTRSEAHPHAPLAPLFGALARSFVRVGRTCAVRWEAARQRTAAALATHPTWLRWLVQLRGQLLALLVLAWLLSRARPTAGELHRLRVSLALWRRSPRAELWRGTLAAVAWARHAWPPLLARLRRADDRLGASIESAIARLLAWMRQLPATLHAAYHPAPTILMLEDLDGDEPGSDGLDGPVAWEHHLSRRARFARVAVIGGTLCLALFLVTGGPAAALAEWQQVAVALTPPRPPAPQPPHLNASYWIAGRLPNSAIFAHGIQLQPAPANSQVAYACWVTHSSDPTHAPQLNIYATTDGARDWVPLTVPTVSPSPVAACRLATDARDSQGALLLLVPSASTSCAMPDLFDTSDGGATWRPVALPAAILATCDLSFNLARGVIYLWSPMAQGQLADTPGAELLSSADDGRSWRPVFDAPARVPGTLVTLVSAAADGAVLILASPAIMPGRAGGAGQQTVLWCHPASGAPWQSLGALPAQTSSAYVLQDPRSTAGCSFPSIFAVGFLARNEPIVTRIEVRTAGIWRVLPPLTSMGDAEFPLGDDAAIVGVGPGGVLLADTVYDGPDVGSQIGSLPGRAFWGWDPRTGNWLPDFYPTPANTAIEGLAWDDSEPASAPRLVCWIYTLNAGVPAFTGVLRATFAVASAPAQDAYAAQGFGR